VLGTFLPRPSLAIANPFAVFEPAEREVEVQRGWRIDFQEHDRTIARLPRPHDSREALRDAASRRFFGRGVLVKLFVHFLSVARRRPLASVADLLTPLIRVADPYEMDEIRSVNLGGLRLSDEPDGRSSTGEVWWCRAEVSVSGPVSGLVAHTRVTLGPSEIQESLPTLLYGLTADWQGWKGARTWSAYEGGLSLSFSHDRLGHILMETRLHDPGLNWELRVDLGLEAGQLDAVARDVERFFAPDLPHRLP
jgi:hypothetical protein